MDLKIVGLVDIIIIIGIIIFAIIGYKKGFSKKILSPLTILLFIGISIVFCSQLAELLISNNIGNGIYENYYNQLSIVIDATGYKDLLVRGLGLWDFLADFLANNIAKMGDFDIDTAAIFSAVYITKLILTIICFFVIFIALIIVAAILRAIGKTGQKVKLIRVIDGLLGIVCYVAIWAVIVCLLFFVLSYAIDFEWLSSVKEFLIVDMKLEDDTFRISKIIYEGNFIKNFIDFIF